MEKSLDTLRVGEHGTVASLRAVGAARRRMLDLGFVPGARVRALHTAPWGDPVAYGVRGAVIALRKRDARSILLEETEN